MTTDSTAPQGGTPANGNEQPNQTPNNTPADQTPGNKAPDQKADEHLQIEDPSKAQEGEKSPEGATIQYDETGDPGLDMALEFIGNLGIGPDHPAMVKAGEGDFSALGEALKAMGDKAKGYEKYLKLGEKAYKDKSESTKAQRAKDTAMIHGVVGGEEQWKAISKWAGENAEPAEREAVNTALRAGGMAAKAMALYLSTLYSKAKGTQVNPAAVKAPGAAGTAPSVGAPLSPAQYQAEIAKLSQQHGPAMIRTPEYKALVARRQAYRG